MNPFRIELEEMQKKMLSKLIQQMYINNSLLINHQKNHYELPKDRLRLLSNELKHGDTKMENGKEYIYVIDKWFEFDGLDFVLPKG